MKVEELLQMVPENLPVGEGKGTHSSSEIPPEVPPDKVARFRKCCKQSHRQLGQLSPLGCWPQPGQLHTQGHL